MLLVRGALAETDLPRAAQLAQSTQRLAGAKPGARDLAAAAVHVRGLIERDSATLEQAASAYSAPLARAQATEDAGLAFISSSPHILETRRRLPGAASAAGRRAGTDGDNDS